MIDVDLDLEDERGAEKRNLQSVPLWLVLYCTALQYRAVAQPS